MFAENNKLEQNLVNRIAKEDDQLAFRDFFDLYYHQLLNFAFFTLESSVAAEEVVSTVFINLWKNRKNLLEIENIQSYLFTSTKHRALNYLRDNQRLMHFKDIDAEDDFLMIDLESPESKLLNAELRDIILMVIENLPPRCKMIFTLVRDDGLKYKQVAELLDISPKTVEVQMGRALSKLKSSLSPYLQNEDFLNFLSKGLKKIE